MKKARILLTAITVCAVVGGALAFKAKTGLFLYTYNGSTCPKVSGNFKITSSGGTNYNDIAYTTSSDQGSSVNTTLCVNDLRVTTE